MGVPGPRGRVNGYRDPAPVASLPVTLRGAYQLGLFPWSQPRLVQLPVDDHEVVGASAPGPYADRLHAVDPHRYPLVGGFASKATMPKQDVLGRLQAAEFAEWIDTALIRGYTTVLPGTGSMIRGEALRRIVVDTNVMASALLFGGNPREVLLQAIRGEIGLGMSPAMLYELQGVLSRKKFGLAEQLVKLNVIFP